MPKAKSPSKSFNCFQCRKQVTEDSIPRYRTFADDFGSSIRDPYYRMCQSCMKENHIHNRKVYACLFLIIAVYLVCRYFGIVNS